MNTAVALGCIVLPMVFGAIIGVVLANVGMYFWLKNR